MFLELRVQPEWKLKHSPFLIQAFVNRKLVLDLHSESPNGNWLAHQQEVSGPIDLEVTGLGLSKLKIELFLNGRRVLHKLMLPEGEPLVYSIRGIATID